VSSHRHRRGERLRPPHFVPGGDEGPPRVQHLLGHEGCDPLPRADPTTDLKDRRIRAHALGPGHINTAIGKTAGLSQEENDAYFERTALDTPLGRNGLADDIAAAALYLASDESAFVTGIELPVDEGYAQI
jgi:hypothetical protein